MDALRLNTEDAPNIGVTHTPSHGTVIEWGSHRVELSKVKSAYFRRPERPKVQSGAKRLSTENYVAEEWGYMLRSMYLELGDKWFNHPNKIVLAEDKPKQLRLAREVGFSVPETVVTNNVDAIKELFESGEVVAKPLMQSLLEDSNKGEQVMFTSTIRSMSDVDEKALKAAPVIFQRKLHKQFDIRVTVVGEDVFSVSIDSQEFDQTKTDWRYGSMEELKHDIFDLPVAVSECCVEIVKRLGLRYGAIDLVLDESGEFWFLECNPNGQWAWVENRTGLPIASAIVSVMERM